MGFLELVSRAPGAQPCQGQDTRLDCSSSEYGQIKSLSKSPTQGHMIMTGVRQILHSSDTKGKVAALPFSPSTDKNRDHLRTCSSNTEQCNIFKSYVPAFPPDRTNLNYF